MPIWPRALSITHRKYHTLNFLLSRDLNETISFQTVKREGVESFQIRGKMRLWSIKQLLEEFHKLIPNAFEIIDQFTVSI